MTDNSTPRSPDLCPPTSDPSPRPTASGQRRTAFTLVELLVVIGIIALLISILLPSLSKAREAGKTLKCQSNLRQLFFAATLYMDNNHHMMFPYVVQWPVDGKTTSFYWPSLLTPYLAPNRTVGNGKEDCFSCPNFPRDTGVPSAQATHYGVNLDHVANSINSNPTPRAMTRYKEPATIMFFVDTLDSPTMRTLYGTTFSNFTAAFPRTYCPFEPAQANGTSVAAQYFATKGGGIDFRHNKNKAACMIYLDGHAGVITPAQAINNEDDIWGHTRWVK